VVDPSWVTCQTETWDALIELKKQGKVRAIGVSNWEIATIQVGQQFSIFETFGQLLANY